MSTITNKIILAAAFLAATNFLHFAHAESFVTHSCQTTEKACRKAIEAGQEGYTARSSSCKIPGHNAKQKQKQKDYCPANCTFVSIPPVGGDICGPFHICWCPESGKSGH